MACITFLIFIGGSYAQDKRTIETKVADLLAQLPSNDSKYTDKLMGDMVALGETGIKMICSQIIPAGTGDDTRARFAVESLSRFLSQKGKETEKASWEKVCIGYATGQKDNGVKDFFMKQLQIVGGDATVTAMKPYLNDKEMCYPALAAIQASGSKTAAAALAESLKNKDLPCAAAVMNALAGMKSELAVNEYIGFASGINVNTRSSALNALAQSSSPLALPVLLKAAKSVLYRWEVSGATSALLNYAKNAGQNGDLKTMDKICKLVMAKCKDKLTIQNKTQALETYVSFHGIDAIKELKKAAENSDKTYRNAALRSSLAIPGKEIVSEWIAYFPKAIPEAKPEIIAMLGERGDESALMLITSSLASPDQKVRSEAAAAIALISGAKAVPYLIEFMRNSTGQTDQEAAKKALTPRRGGTEALGVRLVAPSRPARRAAAEAALQRRSSRRQRDEGRQLEDSIDEAGGPRQRAASTRLRHNAAFREDRARAMTAIDHRRRRGTRRAGTSDSR